MKIRLSRVSGYTLIKRAMLRFFCSGRKAETIFFLYEVPLESFVEKENCCNIRFLFPTLFPFSFSPAMEVQYPEGLRFLSYGGKGLLPAFLRSTPSFLSYEVTKLRSYEVTKLQSTLPMSSSYVFFLRLLPLRSSA